MLTDEKLVSPLLYTPCASDAFAPGDFGFIVDVDARAMLVDAWTALTDCEAWDVVLDEPAKGFLWTEPDARLVRVHARLAYKGHSGFTYAWTMRTMQAIARNGWSEYVYATLHKPILRGGRPLNSV